MGKTLVLGLFVLVCVEPAVKAQSTIVPSGTLLRCVLDEPNFSPKTVEVGDPVVCRLSQVIEFGHNVFPHGSYVGGRLEEDKEPGHFVGKGNMKIVFDHIGMPNIDEQLDAKMVAAQGQKVDKKGEIVGRGHAKRDVAEWMIPVLWPWKVVMLPARGPEPKLKSEEVITLRLMEDIEIPQLAAYSLPPSQWHPFGGSDPSVLPRRQSYVQPNPGTSLAGTEPQKVSFQKSASNTSAAQATLLALRSQAVYPMTDYWVADRRIYFVSPNGQQESTDIDNVDWRQTGELNAERGVRLSLRTRIGPF